MEKLRKRLASLGIIVLLAAGACGRNADENAPLRGVITLSDQFSGDYSLVGIDARPVAATDFQGRIQFVYFGFATCPDVCPLALGRMSAALNELTDAERNQIAPIFITVDPERDTPEALGRFLAFDERIIGLTGDADAVRHALEAFKVYAQKRPLDESGIGYTMDHTSLFYIVDRQGTPRHAMQDTLSPAEIAQTLRKAARGS